MNKFDIMRAGLLSGVAATFLVAAPALAQGMDYSTLQQMFGEPVTTSATGKPQRASDVPVAMTIISQEEIRRSGAASIPAVLQRLTSLDVNRYLANHYEVGPRGYSAPTLNFLLVLVNGRQVFLEDNNRVIWDVIPVQMDEIQQIEVVKGANSALFGFNAVIGVINIVTFNPAYDKKNSVNIRVGTHGERQVSAMTTIPVGSAGGIRVSVGHSQMDNFSKGIRRLETIRNSVVDYNAEFARSEGVFALNETIQAGFEASYATAGRSEVLNGTYASNDFPHKIWSGKAFVNAETPIGRLDASVYHNDDDNKCKCDFSLPNKLSVGKVSLLTDIGGVHTLRPEIELRKSSTTFMSSNYPTSQVRYGSVAASLMWNWILTPSLSFTASGRYDHMNYGASGYGISNLSAFRDEDFDRNTDDYSYNLGFRWRIDDLNSVRLSASRGVGTPSASQLGAQTLVVAPTFRIALTGDPSLPSTIVDSYDVGFDRQIEAINGSLSIGLFSQKLSNVKDFDLVSFWRLPPKSPLPFFIVRNVGTTTSKGIEASVKGMISKFDWHLDYRYVDVNDDFIPSAALNFQASAPKNILVAGLGYHEDVWGWDLYGRYVSGQTSLRMNDVGAVRPTPVDSFWTFATNVTYRPTDALTLGLTVENLQARQTAQTAMLEVERRASIYGRFEF